jgi:WD40 repeat protein
MGVIYSAGTLHPESTLTKIGIQPGKIVRHMELSADQRFLFSIGPHELCAWDLHARALCWRRDIAVACLASAPGSQSIACGFEDGDILELDSRSGQTIRTVGRLPRSVDEVTISPSGQSLACVSADRRVQVFDWTTGDPLWQHDGCANFIGSVHSLCFSPCGRLLVGPTAENPSHLTVWDVQSGEPLNILRGHTKFIMGARFIASDRLVSWGTDGTVRTWDVTEPAEPRVASLVPPLQSS